jgi:hypothetical protein
METDDKVKVGIIVALAAAATGGWWFMRGKISSALGLGKSDSSDAGDSKEKVVKISAIKDKNGFEWEVMSVSYDKGTLWTRSATYDDVDNPVYGNTSKIPVIAGGNDLKELIARVNAWVKSAEAKAVVEYNPFA